MWRLKFPVNSKCLPPILVACFLLTAVCLFFSSHPIPRLSLHLRTAPLTSVTSPRNNIMLTTANAFASTTATVNSRNTSYVDQFIEIVNSLGNQSERIEMTSIMDKLIQSSISSWEIKEIMDNVTAIYDSIEKRKLNLTGIPILSEVTNTNASVAKTQIYLAVIACGDRVDQAMTMLKSAALFSQDAKLHIIVFYDDESKQKLALNLLELRMTAEAMKWEITFEMHEGSYPEGNENLWKNMYLRCTNQRLFFPSLLTHIDSVIYLDSDVVVVSSLTEFWAEFEKKMKDQIMFAAAQNSEPGIYDIYTWKPVPYMSPMGINAGVALMNLTQMREFKFEERAIAVYTAYKELVQYADQDILNMVFGAFPERTATLECSYNFYRVYCDSIDYPLEKATTMKTSNISNLIDNGTSINPNETNTEPPQNVTPPNNRGFCHSVPERGIQIIHGVAGSFNSVGEDHAFFPQVYNAFKNMDLLTDSYLKTFAELRKAFEALPHRPCFPLTADLVYQNGERYLKALGYGL